MKRRDFIIRTVSGLAAAQVPAPLVAGARFSRNPFTLGVASGDVTEHSVVLWTRLAPEPMAADGGVKQGAVPVRWELSPDADMRQVIRQGETTALPRFAHSVHIDIQGLEPGREYWYRFFVASHASEPGRTKTLPPTNGHPESIRFATASCQNYTHGYFVAYDHLLADNPDFVIHLGDYIYDTSFGQTFRKHDTERAPVTLTDYRRRHALYKTDKHLQRAHGGLPFFSAIDNHDAIKDLDPAGLTQRAAAYQAWYEHMPVRGYGGPGGNQFQLRRNLRLGDLAQINLLDTRQFRDKQVPCRDDDGPTYGFGNYRIRCDEMFNEERSMLGKAQEWWLKKNIITNRAAWNVIASTSPFSPFRFYIGEKTLNYVGGWDAYPANRKRIVDAINQAPANAGRTIILSGDLHSFWAIDGAQSTAAADRIPTVEFVTSSITAGWPEPMAKPVTDNLARNPQVKFHEPRRRGYLLHEVTAMEWQTTARAVNDVKNAQSSAFDLARFIIEKGEPGFRQIL